ncbi:ABC-2 type transporter [Micromonospora sp. L5]|uniref:ABC transporter permease n=1 Tax=Micromonospora TaxID=1873 RepID=UPI0001C45C78|nr:ABC transporter permease [Micromonospora sp. L5]ADU06385.1 ABC-2 type transporter [Micromonospora sp. L5]
MSPGSGWLSTAFVMARLQLRTISASGFFLLAVLGEPLVIALIVMATAGSDTDRLSVVGGVAQIGIWSAALFGSANMFQSMRAEGTLAHLASSPAPFYAMLTGVGIGSSVHGLYAMGVATLLGVFAFSVSLPGLSALPMILIALLSALIAVGLLGVLLANLLALYPQSNVITNLLSYPIWLLCGFVTPVEDLPAVLRPLSYALAPTWSNRALDQALHGEAALQSVGWALGISAVYFVIGQFLVRRTMFVARVRGTLELL